MNKEIKEIRDILFELQFLGDDTQSKVVKLHDYITNLQQELEEEKRIEEADLKTIQRLEEENKRLKEYYDIVVEFNQKSVNKLCDYKSRCEEVLEYMKSLCYIESKNEWFTYGDDLNPKYIANVLQNGCEKNVSDRD